MPLGMGLLSGFLGAAGEERKRVADDQLRRDEFELRILGELSKSPDTEIAQHAIAGLLNFADPRAKRKGLAGFVGETAGHPALPTIRALIGQGRQEPTVTDPGRVANLPFSQRHPEIRQTPGPGAAALPATSPVQGGPMTPPSPAGAGGGVGRGDEGYDQVELQQGPSGPVAVVSRSRPGPVAAAAPRPAAPPTPPPSLPTVGTQTVPRRVFSSGPYEDRLRGLVEGAASVGAPLSPQQKQQIALELAGFSGGGLGAGGSVGEGNVVPDPSSPTGFSQLLYSRQTGAVTSRIPAMDPKKTASAAAGLSTVINPVTGEVFVVSKPGVMAGDPHAVQAVGAPGQAPQPPQTPGAPPAPPMTPQGTVAPGAPPASPGTLNVGGIADRKQAAEDATLLSPTENRAYGTPSGTTRGDVRQRGLLPRTEQEQQAIDDVDRALTLLPKIRDLTMKLFGDRVLPNLARMMPFVGGGAERLAQEASLTNLMNTPEYADLNALIEAALPGAARISGNRGNLSEQERENARASFPNLGKELLNVPDTASMAIQKVQSLEQRLRNVRGIFAGGAEPPLQAGTAPPTAPAGAQAGPPPVQGGPPVQSAPKQFVEDREGIWVVEGVLPNGQYDAREATPQEIAEYYTQRKKAVQPPPAAPTSPAPRPQPVPKGKG